MRGTLETYVISSGFSHVNLLVWCRDLFLQSSRYEGTSISRKNGCSNSAVAVQRLLGVGDISDHSNGCSPGTSTSIFSATDCKACLTDTARFSTGSIEAG
eukprot:COSAG05_NODE_13257_length_436_cov_1.148368_1_plen_100_part_01